jgi:hypothetical protein
MLVGLSTSQLVTRREGFMLVGLSASQLVTTASSAFIKKE